MVRRLKRLVHDLMPPLLMRRLRPPPPSETPQQLYGYFGDYASYEAAQAECSGYDTPTIAEVVARSRQDTIEKTKLEIDERIIEVLAAFSVAIGHLNKKTISVLDYGGGNGYYCDIISRLLPFVSFTWTVVETPSMVSACSEHRHIRWLTEMPDEKFDITLLSGILQVLPNPYDLLNSCASKSNWLIIQKVPTAEQDRITRQVVPPHLHGGSYPHMFFAHSNFLGTLISLGSVEMAWTVEKERESYPQTNGLSRGFLVRSSATRPNF